MTLKHIDFYDSPVMRDLARQELEKGTVSVDVKSIVKAASLKKNAYAVTGNLYDDMFALASGLRTIGLVAKAEVLEKKILDHKLAAAEFDKILSDAHPGPVEVAESDDDYGMIETLESRHEKVLEVVNKKPTGKQAAAQNILKIAGQILKSSQAALPKDNSQEASQETSAPSFDEMEESILGGGAEKVQAINAELPKYWSEIGSAVKAGLADINPSTWVFQQGELFSNPVQAQKYASYFTKEPILEFLNKYLADSTAIFGSLVYPANMYQSLYKILESKNYNSLRALVGQVDPKLSAMCTGVATPLLGNSGSYPLNENSVWTYRQDLNLIDKIMPGDKAKEKEGLYLNGKFPQLVSAVYDSMRNTYIVAVDSSKISQASAALAEEMESALADYKAIAAKYAGEPSLISKDARSVASLIHSISQDSAVLKSYMAEGQHGKQLLKTTKSMWPSWTPAVVAKAAAQSVASIQSLVTFLNNNAISQRDVVMTDEMISQLSNPLSRAMKSLIAEYKSLPANSPEYKQIRTLASGTYQALQIVQANAGKTFFNLSQEISGFFAAKNYGELLQKLNDWAAQNAGTEDEAKADDGLVSTADLQRPGGPGKPATPAAKPSGAPAVKAPAKPVAGPNPAAGLRPDGTFSGTLDETPEKEAVRKMQALLIQLGDKLNDPSLKAVGKNGAPVPDGAWGGGTAAILEKAIKAMNATPGVKLNLFTGPKQGLGWGGYGKDTADKANQNSTVLRTFLGISESANKTTGSDVKIGVIPVNNGNHITLTAQDISSLTSLYDMFRRAGATEVRGVNENSNQLYSGMPYKQFFAGMTLVWNSVKGWYDGNPTGTAAYYQSVRQRFTEMLTYADRNALTVENPQSVVNREDLVAREGAKPGSGGESGAGYTENEGRGGRGGRGRNPGSGGGVGEGEDVAVGHAAYPFPFLNRGDIDLKMDVYYRSISAIIRKQVLYLRTFRARGSQQLAYALFSSDNVANVKTAFTMFLNSLSKSLNNAVRIYASSSAQQQSGPDAEKISQWQADAFDYNTQWQEAIGVLKSDLANW